MSTYAHRHHPQVQARRLASGIDTMNSFRPDEWRRRLLALGINPPKRTTKTQLYAMWRKAIEAKS